LFDRNAIYAGDANVMQYPTEGSGHIISKAMEQIKVENGKQQQSNISDLV